MNEKARQQIKELEKELQDNCSNCEDLYLYPDEACPECGRDSNDNDINGFIEHNF